MAFTACIFGLLLLQSALSDPPRPAVAAVVPACLEVVRNSPPTVIYQDQRPVAGGKPILDVPLGELPIHHSEVVRVAGILQLMADDHRLLRQFDSMSLHDSVWLRFPYPWSWESSRKRAADISGRCARVEGRYLHDPYVVGLLGAIELQRVEVWTRPKDPLMPAKPIRR